MKRLKLLLIIILLIPTSEMNAQQFKSPSFDSVYIGGIDRIWNWITSDAGFMGGSALNDTLGPVQPNYLFNMGQGNMLFGHVDIYYSSPFSPVAVKLNTTNYKKNNGDPYETFIVNGNHFYTGNDGYIDFSKCGVPFTYRPDSLTGYYQYIDSNLSNTDYGICIFLLKKYDSLTKTSDTIAYQIDSMSFSQNTWSRFSFPITYLSSGQPDTMITIFKASTRPLEVSSFWLDNLEFIYGPNATNDFISSNKLPFVYPNPNSGILNINAKGYKLIRYNIFDINGRLIQKGDFHEQIKMPPQSQGILFLNIYDKNGLIKTYRINSNQ